MRIALLAMLDQLGPNLQRITIRVVIWQHLRLSQLVHETIQFSFYLTMMRWRLILFNYIFIVNILMIAKSMYSTTLLVTYFLVFAIMLFWCTDMRMCCCLVYILIFSCMGYDLVFLRIDMVSPLFIGLILILFRCVSLGILRVSPLIIGWTGDFSCKEYINFLIIYFMFFL